MNIDKFLAKFEQAIKDLPKELAKAEEKTLEEALDMVKALSDGPFSTAQLRQMFHPYAKRYPAPPQDPGIINAQSGDFRDAWEKEEGTWQEGTLTNSLKNEDKKADWLRDGTKLMIARPLEEAMKVRIQARREANLNNVLKEIETK